MDEWTNGMCCRVVDSLRDAFVMSLSPILVTITPLVLTTHTHTHTHARTYVRTPQAYKRTLELIEEKKEQVIAVAELLIEKETITHDDVASLIGARPFSAGKVRAIKFMQASEYSSSCTMNFFTMSL